MRSALTSDYAVTATRHGGVLLAERTGLAQVQVDSVGANAADVERALASLPAVEFRAQLAPLRWLLVSQGAADEFEAGVRAALAALQVTLCEVTHGRTVLIVEGSDACTVLAKGCSLDARALAPGMARQAVVAGIAVLVRATRVDAFELHVPRSYALSFWEWLRDACAATGYHVAEARR